MNKQLEKLTTILTKEEFINYLMNNSNCPDDYDLSCFDDFSRCGSDKDFCKICIENAIKNLNFKNNTNKEPIPPPIRYINDKNKPINHNKNRMKKYVIQCLIDDYNYSKKDATKLVNNSVFNEMLETDTEFVMHYSVEYWAKDVINDYNENIKGDKLNEFNNNR